MTDQSNYGPGCCAVSRCVIIICQRWLPWGQSPLGCVICTSVRALGSWGHNLTHSYNLALCTQIRSYLHATKSIGRGVEKVVNKSRKSLPLILPLICGQVGRQENCRVLCDRDIHCRPTHSPNGSKYLWDISSVFLLLMQIIIDSRKNKERA